MKTVKPATEGKLFCWGWIWSQSGKVWQDCNLCNKRFWRCCFYHFIIWWYFTYVFLNWIKRQELPQHLVLCVSLWYWMTMLYCGKSRIVWVTISADRSACHRTAFLTQPTLFFHTCSGLCRNFVFSFTVMSVGSTSVGCLLYITLICQVFGSSGHLTMVQILRINPVQLIQSIMWCHRKICTLMIYRCWWSTDVV